MYFSIKTQEELRNLKNLEGMKRKAKQVPCNENLGQQGYEFDTEE